MMNQFFCLPLFRVEGFWSRSLWLFGVILISTLVDIMSIGAVIPFLSTVLDPSYDFTKKVIFLSRFVEAMSYHARLFSICFGVIFLFSAKFVLVTYRNYLSARFSNHLRFFWMEKILRNYLCGEFKKTRKNKQGVILHNMSSETLNASKGVFEFIDMVVGVLVVLALSVLLLVLNWRLTLIAAAVIGVVGTFFWRINIRYAKNFGKARLEQNQLINQLLMEAITGIKHIKILGGEFRVISDLGHRCLTLMKLNTVFAVINALPHSVGELLLIVLVVLGLVLNVFFLHLDIVTVFPMLIVFSGAFLRLFQSVATVFSKRMSFITYLPSINLVSGLTSENDDEQGREDIRRANSVSGIKKIEVSDLFFRFEATDLPIISGLSLSMAQGEVVALVGRSGCGKTTFCDILTGLHRVETGSVSVDGIDLSLVDVVDWRKHIGYVSQDVFLFHATIRENLLFAKPTATNDEILEALHFSDALGFVQSLPSGEQTVVGEGGFALSGGQKQRIALARAFLRQSMLLVLDEATSGLDSESEYRIMKSVQDLKKDRIVVIISHRLQSLQWVDRIVFMDEGRVLETGTYNELLAKKGAFWELVNLQLEK